MGDFPLRERGGCPEITMGVPPANSDGMPTPTVLNTDGGTVEISCTRAGGAGSTAWCELVVGPPPVEILTMTRVTTMTMTRPTAPQASRLGVRVTAGRREGVTGMERDMMETFRRGHAAVGMSRANEMDNRSIAVSCRERALRPGSRRWTTSSLSVVCLWRGRSRRASVGRRVHVDGVVYRSAPRPRRR